MSIPLLRAMVPVRAATRLRWTAFVTLFLWTVTTPGMSAHCGAAVAEGLPYAGQQTVDVLDSAKWNRGNIHKWFISVVSMHNCGACERLTYDLARAESLAEFVDVNDREASWSHYNLFHWENAAHRRHWQHAGLTLFPTIIIQPPLSGEFGDPRTIVLKKVGYDGDEQRLAQEIRSAITTYVANLPDDQRARSILVALPAEADLRD